MKEKLNVKFCIWAIFLTLKSFSDVFCGSLPYSVLYVLSKYHFISIKTDNSLPLLKSFNE